MRFHKYSEQWTERQVASSESRTKLTINVSDVDNKMTDNRNNQRKNSSKCFAKICAKNEKKKQNEMKGPHQTSHIQKQKKFLIRSPCTN